MKIKIFKNISKTTMIFLAVVFLFCCSVSHAQAANHYIRDGATGTGDCGAATNSWADACDSLPDTLVRGDTYYIAGGSYGEHTFNTAASGAIPIYIKKATVADHGTETGWNSSYGSGVAQFAAPLNINTAYWIFDGQSRITANSGHGIKISNTLCYQKHIQMTGTPDHISLRYIEFAGLGDDGDCRISDTQDGANDQLYANDADADNATLEYCYFHDAGRTHLLTGAGADNWLIQHCYFGTVESHADEHGEPLNVDRSANWIIRYNIFNETEGTGVIMVEDSQGATGWEIYGNLFSNFSSNNGAIATDADYSCDNPPTNRCPTMWYSSKVYNNTFVNGMGINQGINPQNGSGADWQVYNNIWYNCSNLANLSSVPHDYNAFSGPNAFGEAHGQANLTSAIFRDYNNDDFSLVGATSAGATLASPYNTDMLGRTRGADGVWDRGAYEYTSGQINCTPADANCDGKIDITDFTSLVSNWLKTGAGLQGDVNNDSKVNTQDLGIMMSKWAN